MSHLLISHTLWLDGLECRMISTPLARRAPVWQGVQSINQEGAMLLTQLQDLVASSPKGKLGLDSLHVVLGAPMVRHALLAWQESLSSDTDWRNYARALFAQQYGVDISQWRITIAEEGYGQTRLAVAMDELIYQTILDVARNARLKIAGVEPLLSHTVNHYFRKINKPECALMILGKQFAHVAFRRENHWQSVNCLAFPHPDQLESDQLMALLRDAAILAGQSLPGEIYFCSTEQDGVRPEMNSDKIIWLGHPLPLFAHDRAAQ